MNETNEKPGKLLLHACCGPCSVEPYRILSEQGDTPDIYYANSNIAPEDEYVHRLDTIRAWAERVGATLEEGAYVPARWEDAVGKPWREGKLTREERCRACYRLRFEEAAAYAARNGYDRLGTTLSVSPYQYTDIIREELERACADVDIEPDFEDWRPYYEEGARRSREAGMYRQNYCGCSISKAEAQQERDERKAARKAEREKYLEEHADEIARVEQEREEKRRDRAAYDAKRSRQRQILKGLRNSK